MAILFSAVKKALNEMTFNFVLNNKKEDTV